MADSLRGIGLQIKGQCSARSFVADITSATVKYTFMIHKNFRRYQNVQNNVSSCVLFAPNLYQKNSLELHP